MSNVDKQVQSVAELIENAPKKLNCEYLRQLYALLCVQIPKINSELEVIARSLVLLVLDAATSVSDQCLAIAILQKLPPVSGLVELLNSVSISQVIGALPVVFVQNFSVNEVDKVIKQLCWSLGHDNLNEVHERCILTFLARVSHSPQCQEEIRRVTRMLPIWISGVANNTPSLKEHSFHRSSSSLSFSEVDGTESKDMFTVLNYSPVTSASQFLNIQVFSMLRSWLLTVSKSLEKCGKIPCPRLADLVTGDLSSTIHEYCLRLMEQGNKKIQGPGLMEYQRSCLIEAISLLDVICCSDSEKIHVILPVIKRVYNDISANILEQPEAKDVAVMVSALQFFINHSSAVMYNHDGLYPFVFCDLLRKCYQDNFASYEIIYVLKENLAQLCYKSSVLEKYFPSLLLVLASWPTTFADDFLLLLPAFMSQNTCIEVLHSLLDLPCLSAMLVVKHHRFNITEERSSLDNTVYEILKNPDYIAASKHLLRKSSGFGNAIDMIAVVESLPVWHNLFLPLASHAKVVFCVEACIPLIKCYFSTFFQYADEQTAVMVFPVMLNRLSLLYPASNFVQEIHKVFAENITQLFRNHPVIVFYCKKIIAQFLDHLKNYYVSQECFIQLMWVVGEYVSVVYSDLCCPDVITYFFQLIEPTVYEIINSISLSSDDQFLKLINVSVSTLSKLTARSQDLLPRALLCLGKAHQQLSSFGCNYRRSWRIVMERILELLTILKTPNVASIMLSPVKDLESGKLHRDATSLPFVLRAVTALLDETDDRKTVATNS